MSDPMTKERLLRDLRESADEVVKRVPSIDPASLETGVHEGGWNGRQILAHVASIEWTYPRMIDIARNAVAPPPPAASRPERAAGEMASSSPQILSYNDRQVEKRAGVAVPELLAEFEKNRAATIAAIETADDALFDIEITSAGGAKGRLADVFHFVAVQHVRGHLRDLAGEA